MMALDGGTRAGTAGFDDIGINGPLDKVIHMADLFGFFLKDADEFLTNDLPLFFRIADAFQFAQEALLCIDADNIHIEVFLEDFFHRIAFIFAEQAVIDKNTGELLAHSLVDKDCRHGGIHTAAHGAQDVLIPDFFTDFLDLGLGEGRHGPVTGKIADAEQEVAEHFLAKGGVHDFRMELDTVEVLVLVDHGSNGAFGGMAGHDESFGYFFHIVLVAHPADIVLFDSGKQAGFRVEDHCRLAVFTGRISMGHDAAQFLGHELMAVAESQHGDPHLKDTVVNGRCVFRIDAARTAGQDDGFRILGFDLFQRICVRNDFAVDSAFTDASGNQLGVLSPEVDDQDQLML